MQNKSLVVIGGGAAGFFCAINAARIHKGLRVILIEKSSKLLSKVKVSGGGRCNVTHSCYSIADLIKYYPRGGSFLKKTFHQFYTEDTIKWFSDREVKLKTEADGRMFPESNSSQTIIDCLLNEANKCGIEILMNTDAKTIEAISPSSSSESNFNITINSGKIIQANYVCVACGGFPKEAHFDWLKNLGHSIETPVPSLFTFNIPKNSITELMGISVPHVSIKISGTKLEQFGPLLITHWGLSGPAILKLSAWGARDFSKTNYEFIAVVNWLPDFNDNTLREEMQQLRFKIAAQKICNRNPFGLPGRLWEYFLKECEIDQEIRWSDLPVKNQNKLVKVMTGQAFQIKGKTTFKEEFVTAGGINLSEIDANTMQSKLVKGLFFAGEIIDVDGVTGGFNFQNAWTTGFIAAKSLGIDLVL